MTHEQLVSMIRRAAEDVFSTMLGVEIRAMEGYVASSPPGPREGLLALIGLAGNWAGSGTFSCSAEMATRLSGRLLMQDYAAVDDEVLDAIGELTNMIIGNVKSELEEKLGPMGLSIPTVVYGRNFTTRSIGNSQWTVLPFECLGETVEVHLCLAQDKSKAAPMPAAQERAPAVLTILG